MSTTYGNLPKVDLPDRWGHRIVSVDGNYDPQTQMNSPVLHTRVTASSAEEAELRSFAVLDYDYEDDLRGAVATAQHIDGALWAVDIALEPYA